MYLAFFITNGHFRDKMMQEKPSVEDLHNVMKELLEQDEEANSLYKRTLEGYGPDITFKRRSKEAIAKFLNKQGVKKVGSFSEDKVLVEEMMRMLERDAFFAGLLTKYEEGFEWSTTEYEKAYDLLNALQYRGGEAKPTKKVVTDEDLYYIMSGILAIDEEEEIDQFYVRVLKMREKGEMWNGPIIARIVKNLKLQEVTDVTPQTDQWILATKMKGMLERDKLLDELVFLYDNDEKWPSGKRETALILLGLTGSTAPPVRELGKEERKDDEELFRLIDIVLHSKNTPDRRLYKKALKRYDETKRFNKEDKQALVESFQRLQWGRVSLLTPDSEVAERVRKIVKRGEVQQALLTKMYDLYLKKGVKGWTAALRNAAWDYLHIPRAEMEVVEPLVVVPPPPARTKLVIRVPPPLTLDQRLVTMDKFRAMTKEEREKLLKMLPEYKDTSQLQLEFIDMKEATFRRITTYIDQILSLRPPESSESTSESESDSDSSQDEDRGPPQRSRLTIQPMTPLTFTERGISLSLSSMMILTTLEDLYNKFRLLTKEEQDELAFTLRLEDEALLNFATMDYTLFKRIERVLDEILSQRKAPVPVVERPNAEKVGRIRRRVMDVATTTEEWEEVGRIINPVCLPSHPRNTQELTILRLIHRESQLQ